MKKTAHGRQVRGPKAKTVNEYLARIDDDQRVALERLRRIVRSAVPRAEECISYQMPAFRVDGRVVAWFGAATNHCSFFPGGIVDAFRDELKDFETSKGTIRFAPDHPLPATLIRKIVKAGIARNAARRARSAGARRRR